MKTSVQNLIQEFKAVVSKKDELRIRDKSEKKSIFAISGLSEFQFHCRDHILGCLETNNPLHVKGFRE